MKKRVLSLLLVMLMVVSLAPMSALAATNGHTANEAIGWVQSQVGKALDYDGAYGAQCVDLIKYYYDYLGCASYARGNGSDYATNALPSGWTRLKGAQPRLGDILVYTGGYNNYGHVAIYESDYVSYHQNFNGKQYVVRATCKYNALNNPYWGVIRPDFGGSAPVSAASWEGPSATNITESNAYLSGKVNFSQTMNTTQVGVRIYDSSNTRIALKDEYVNYNTTYVNIWYDVTGELGIYLKSGQSYKFQFYTISNGKEYWSPIISFATAHTHNYASKVVQPTCTAQGYTIHTCSCGNSYKDSYVNALGHSYSGGACTRCGQKDPNYTQTSGVRYVLSDGVLTVSGSGECTNAWMNNYSPNNVKKIVIGSGITSIGRAAFQGCAYVKSVDIANGVTKICRGAFTQCWALDYVIIPTSVNTIEMTAFGNAISGSTMNDVYYCGSAAQWGRISIGEHNDSLLKASFHYNYDPNMSFTDVAAGSYCYDAVQWAVANGITNGTDATHFSPNAGCTRGQVVTFLWRAAGEPTVSGNVGFVDVAPGSYCYEAVKWAVANGITKGTDATHFSPNATCTRGQVVTFMYRAAGEPAVGGSNGFVDVAAGSYCYNAVQWAVAKGITKGTDTTHFSPSATCTRGQVVTFLYRAE
ncbi:MAG: S-layer homology domain-containing protein [Oscillospiraceae bacterium]|nr:S-layer homology domain-containing protein [Oscillospiraceae bacterium]